MEQEEIWKTYKITHHPKKGTKVWEISNLGRIKLNGVLVKPRHSGKYYSIAGEFLHRIVAKLYIPNKENKSQVDHINGDRSDNRSCNLRWVTPKENSSNPITKQRQKEVMNSESYHNNMSAALKGKRLPQETKIKISKSHTGKHWYYNSEINRRIYYD